MKKLALAAAMSVISMTAMAAEGDILARFRVIDVSPDSSWSNSGAVPGLTAKAKDAWAPELDFTYMVTNNIGTELILATTRHEITTNAFGSVRKVSVLPPTLMAQYHLSPEATFRPYVGAGLNYTRFYNSSLQASGVTSISVKNNSFGPALQVGTDFAVSKDWYLNLDIKKIWIQTDASADQLGGAKLGTLKIDPWVIGTGIGTKF
jgi:outer membrane protein